ncbi:hypothetical protein B0H14DRAFT_2601900 [Mycena olivaceomarginata]|nr:hypothetical protein B0H14DRAFT_2601900 [Mycena olivaceomarginata]
MPPLLPTSRGVFTCALVFLNLVNVPSLKSLLHALHAYRSTNRKNEFSQMTLRLERKEKIPRHHQFVEWKLRGSPPPLIPICLRPRSSTFDVPFNAVPVFQRIKFSSSDPYGSANGPTVSIVDSIHIQPPKRLKTGDEIPALARAGSRELLAIELPRFGSSSRCHLIWSKNPALAHPTTGIC